MGNDDTVRLWNAEDGRIRRVLEGRALEDERRTGVRYLDIGYATFSPDGQCIAAASAYGTATIWNASDGQILLTLGDHQRGVNWVAFSPDSRQVLTASGDHTVRLWKIPTGQLEADLAGHSGSISMASFSPDGKWI